MTLYETIIVFDSFLKGDDMQNLVTKIQNFITNNGGKIEQVEEWGKKRLAYEINRKQYGNYLYILFSGLSSIPALLEREYRLEESVLRYFTIKADPKDPNIMEKADKEKEQLETSTEDINDDSSVVAPDIIDQDDPVIKEESDDITPNDEKSDSD